MYTFFDRLKCCLFYRYGSQLNEVVIKLSFYNAVASEFQSRKLELLKKGNENVYFKIDGKVVLTTASTYMFFDEPPPIVFIGDKKVKLELVNSLLKRNRVKVDWKKSDALSKQLRKEVIVFLPSNESDEENYTGEATTH